MARPVDIPAAVPDPGAAQARALLWRRNLLLTALLLAIWFAVSFVVPYHASELSAFTVFGWPLPYYMGAQGAMVVYLLIILYYSRAMRRLERAAEGDLRD
jgi:putative solute:sodium symporter small subunit